MLNIQQVLDITELRLHIIQFLDGDDRLACALVNKAWHHDFLPSVWESFRIVHPAMSLYAQPKYITHAMAPAPEKERAEQQLASLQKHAHLIRHLHRDWSCPRKQSRSNSYMAVFLEHCRRLVSLQATISPLDPDGWTLCVELAMRNPGLQRAELNCDMAFSEAISSHSNVSFYRAWRASEIPSLRRLVLGRKVSFLALACLVMKACPALEDLVLYEGTMTHASDDVKQYLDSEEDSGYHGSDDDMTMNNLLEAFDLSCTKEWMWDPYPQFGLKRLEFGRACYNEGLGMFLVLCPLLETLFLRDICVRVCEEFCRVLRGGFLPNLTSLTLNIDHVDESWMLEVLEALPMHQLQYVDLCGATARDIKELVERQHKSLKDMHLRGLHYAEEEDQDGHDDIQGSVNHSGAHNLGSAVCNILASCSQLRTLIILAGMLEEFDIRHLIAQPWVCMALRTLEIPVVLAHKCSDPRLLRHAEAEKRQAAWQGRLPRQLPPLLQSDEAQYDVQLSQSAEELEEWDQCEVVWMKYLGQLNQLRVLKLRRALGTISDKLAEPIYLTWTMSLGLGYLKNLTLLEHLRLPPHSVLQDECEWMFMKQHWPKLRMLQTRLGLPLLETYKNQIHEVWPELTVK